MLNLYDDVYLQVGPACSNRNISYPSKNPVNVNFLVNFCFMLEVILILNIDVKVCIHFIKIANNLPKSNSHINVRNHCLWSCGK